MKKKYLQIASILIFGSIISLSTCLAQNKLDLDSWNIGSGWVGSFEANGSDAENIREWGTTPHETRGILWKAIPDGFEGADGGWNATAPINSSKMHRLTVWIKKTNSADGFTYFGCSGVSTLNGEVNDNPYFWYGDLPKLDHWYLLVGYIQAFDDVSTVSLGGIYDGQTGQKVITMEDFRFYSSTTTVNHRAYLYYDPNINDRQYFYGPRLEVVDGNEPTINALLGIEGSQKDINYFSGKVGIKTADPKDYDLAVNGKIRSQEIKVETANWPDYVFKSDYDLKSLREIESFVKINGHLPGLPKAEDAERDGISLGEMNKILLKKIEELTLYLIEKDEEMQIIKNEIKILKNR